MAEKEVLPSWGAFLRQVASRVDAEGESGGFLIPPDVAYGYYVPYTRWERVRNLFLRLLRRPVPERRWCPGLLERREKFGPARRRW